MLNVSPSEDTKNLIFQSWGGKAGIGFLLLVVFVIVFQPEGDLLIGLLTLAGLAFLAVFVVVGQQITLRTVSSHPNLFFLPALTVFVLCAILFWVAIRVTTWWIAGVCLGLFFLLMFAGAFFFQYGRVERKIRKAT
jgi:hypothetical protein